MANKIRGEITVKYQGKDIILVLTTNAICDLEDSLDRRITDILDEISNPEAVRMKTIRHIFRAMMKTHSPEATLEQAGELIDSLQGSHDKVMSDALVAAFPEANGKAAPEK